MRKHWKLSYAKRVVKEKVWKEKKKTKKKIVDKHLREIIDSSFQQSTIFKIMTTKKFASTFRSNIEIEYLFRHSKNDVDNMFSTLKHCDSKFVIEIYFANALLKQKFFFFWTEILKIFNEFLNKNYANAISICVWCFLKILFFSFTLKILKVFWYWFLWIFWNFANKTQSCWFYLLYWYCFLYIENQRIERENNCNTFALSKR